MTNKNWLSVRACPESVQWARDYTDDAVAWRECQRGDWMLWLLGQIDVDRKRLVLATSAASAAAYAAHAAYAAAYAAHRRRRRRRLRRLRRIRRRTK